MMDGQSDEVVDLIFKLMEFFNEEKELFKLHAKNNDYTTYMNGYRIAFDKVFPQMSKR